MGYRYIILFLFILSFQLELKGQRVRHIIRTVHPNTARIARLQTKIMEKRMKLNTVQSEKVNSINSEYLQKLTDLQSNTNLSQEEKIKQLNVLRESKIISLKQVLDESQFKEYLKLHQELQDQRSKRIKDQNPDPGADALNE